MSMPSIASSPPLPAIAQVIVELPLETPLDYRIPDAWRPGCAVGQRVLVPVGNRQVLGYIVGLAMDSAMPDLREVVAILDERPLLTPELLWLTHWVAGYYMCPWGQVLKTAIPEGFRVQTVAVYTLTVMAQQQPQAWPAGKAGEVLRLLAQQGPQRQQDLSRTLELANLAPLLRRLQQQGWVCQEQQRQEPKVRQRTVAGVCLRLAPAETQALQQRLQKRAPNQAAVLALLLTQATWELPALQRQLPGAAAAVKRLAQQGAVTLTRIEKMRQVVPAHDPQAVSFPVLTPAQQHAMMHIESKLASPDGTPVLLHGVTGSGKTEVYMRAIAEVLRQGKTALVLVPEIALTTQLVQRFVARFASHIAVLHSGLSGGERFDEWRRLARGEAQIAIGARSAVFAPLQRLGLIVVDEEHDTSYKQEETPRYHARDVAIVRAQHNQAAIILGSATPALETFHNVQSGKYDLLALPQRVEDRLLPHITVVDQRTQAAANERVISTPLYQAITACLARQEQCLILINRRGFAAYLQCRTCGLVPSCVHCSVSLTYHRREHTLRCHYCGFAQPMLTLCPTCNTPSLQLYGLGTQQVEAAVQTLFPNARLGRMDRDTTRGKLSHHHILQALSQGDIDILVGTQMIAKGHDYPNITLVGVVAADASLAIPDFRAPERLFQLLTQVAGRAGRGEAPGQVFIQTYRPEHYSIDFAREHNFSGFSQDELPRRQAMLYPPYARLARLIVESPEANRAQAASQWLGTVLQRQLADHADVMLLGPAEAPLTKINDRYRWHILVRTVSSRTLHAFLSASLADMRQQRRHLQGARLSIDIDPLTFL